MIWYTAGAAGQWARWITGRLPPTDYIQIAIALPVLQDTTFFLSLSWILYRIWQIYQKPVDELVDLLGLDIPPAPDVSLGAVTSESVLLFFRPADNQSTSLKNAIQVNGIKVGEFGLKDNSLQVTGLKPGHFYNIRVIASNPANFSTLGPLIRLRTVLALEKDGFDSTRTINDADEQLSDCEPAGIRAGPSHLTPMPNIPYQVAKESSATQANSRKSVSGRRVSPAIPAAELPSTISSRAASVDEDDSEEAIQRLTEQLDRLRREQYDTDRHIEDEDQEHLASIADLTKNREDLRQTLKEKEESTAELRKHGAHLEKMNRAAQLKKIATEKALEQKQTERAKVTDDMDHWDKEIMRIRHGIDQTVQETEQVASTRDEDVVNIRNSVAEDHSTIKNLEEEIRMMGGQIKMMEKHREHLEGNNDEEQEHGRDGDNGQYAWEIRAQAVQAQLAAMWNTLQQAEAENQQAHDRVGYWISRRSRDSSHTATSGALDQSFASRAARFKRQHQIVPRIHALPPPYGASQAASIGGPYSSSNISSQFSSASPFFNMSNGMSVAEIEGPSTSEYRNQSFYDNENLAGGGPMSPAADDLLPSNLFRDDDIMLQESPTAARYESSAESAADWAGRHSTSPVDRPETERHTPGSVESRRGSLLSSPHESLRNVHPGQITGESFVDNDQLSYPATDSSVLTSPATGSNPLSTSRLAQFFPNFNRQRGKSSSHEPPALGTLKQGQSQSFPRQVDQDSMDTLETRRRRGSYGNWALPMNLMNRHGVDTGGIRKDEPGANTQASAGPRYRFSMFGPRVDTDSASAFRERSASRPSSMYSFDQIRGRPSSDSQRLNGWPVTENTPSRSSPLGTHWTTSGGPWSRAPSRRPSVQHGSTSNLSIGSTPLDSEAYDSALAPQRSEQLPIGTRPISSQRFSSPKLNPAAPTFKTIFGRSEARKAAKAEKANEKAAEKDRAREVDKIAGDENAQTGEEESASSQSRLSRDGVSITTAGSVADSHDSLDHSTSGSAADAAPSSAGTRESLMQKISWKSSSSKFNVPWGKERGGLFSKKNGEPSTPDEVEEDAPSEEQIIRSSDSIMSTPQQEKGSRSSLSWPNMRRKSKKGGTAAEKGAEAADDDNM
ncbi:MAG: hypothetical protein Q9220_002622 [cf. Caloplaca sp. 1 TL-2023]